MVKVPYGGSGVLAPWVKVKLVEVTYGGSGGLLPWLGSLIRDARTLNDASNTNYLNLILIIFMKFKIELSKHTSLFFLRYSKVSNKRVYNSGLGSELGVRVRC